MSQRTVVFAFLVGVSAACAAAPLSGQNIARSSLNQAATCDFSGVPGAVWWGTERLMSIQRFAQWAFRSCFSVPVGPHNQNSTAVQLLGDEL